MVHSGGMSTEDTGEKYYFNLRTREVEQGPQSIWADRLGPYDTYDEAVKALDRAKERNEIWDEQDAENDPSPPTK